METGCKERHHTTYNISHLLNPQLLETTKLMIFICILVCIKWKVLLCIQIAEKVGQDHVIKLP